jgi:hypothetical protein
MYVVVFLLLMMSAAYAKDLTINDQDQAAVQQICDIAAASAALNRDNRAAVANWCVSWARRIEAPIATEQNVTVMPKSDKATR